MSGSCSIPATSLFLQLLERICRLSQTVTGTSTSPRRERRVNHGVLSGYHSVFQHETVTYMKEFVIK